MAKSVSSHRSKSQSGRRHKPLAEDIHNTGPLRQSKKRKLAASVDKDEDHFLDSKSSAKVLRIGQELIQEDERGRKKSEKSATYDLQSRHLDEVGSDNEAHFGNENEEEAWRDEEEEVEEVEVDPNDLDLFNKFMPPDTDPILNGPILGGGKTRTEPVSEEAQGRNLGDIIFEKLIAHEAQQQKGQPELVTDIPSGAIEIPAKVVEVYTKVGYLLSRYRSGKIPKPFKIIPTIPYWEDLLAMTKPESWTPHACYEATRIFASAKSEQCERFMETVILDRVREDILENKKLNVHLYNSLRKSLYKPAAFFKGFLFPLIESGTCTLREAHVISSVLVKVSVPSLHSSAALLKLCDIAAEQSSVSIQGGGPTNIFIRVLLEKKYALPYKVIDALVFHFLRFRASDPTANEVAGAENAMLGVAGQESKEAKEAKLPILWHESLLAFAQRYRNDITEDQREALLDLLLIRGHHRIGVETRRELLEGRGRGVLVQPAEAGDDGDDTMLVDPSA